MRNLYSLFLLLMVGVGLAQPALGQTTPTISGQFADIPFGQFVTDIEARTNYRFYYNPTETDSLRVRIQATDKTLPYLLSRVFEGTAFRFAIDSRNRVFITIDQAIRTELPIGFFERGRPTTTTDSADVDYGAGREKARVSLETKLFEIGSRSSAGKPGYATLAGHIRNGSTGEPVVGVAVLIEKPRIGVLTDQYGYYSLALPRGRHELKIRSIGLRDTKRQLLMLGDGQLESCTYRRSEERR